MQELGYNHVECSLQKLTNYSVHVHVHWSILYFLGVIFDLV